MRLLTRTLTLAAALFSAGPVLAGVTFSNVMVGGSLAAGATFSTGAGDVDFMFSIPAATVGDSPLPATGDLVIMYEAESDDGLPQSSIVVSILGALAGTGVVSYSETVEDLNTPGQIGSYDTVLDADSTLPDVMNIDFSRDTTRIKVTKTLNFTSEDVPSQLDLAQISLIEEKHVQVPEPASLALLSLTGLLGLRRRG